MFYVRSEFVEDGRPVHLHEGPWERYFAELVCADIGVDASIPRGIDRVTVTSSRVVSEAEVPAEERYGAQG